MRILFLKIVFATLVVIGMSYSRPALADLTITPTRIVMGDKDRFAVVTLINTSDSLKTYQIGYKYYKMEEKGAPYQEATGSTTAFDLGKHLVFSPRRISLAPGAKQKIRLALHRPAEPIPPGDYRVHLEFSSVPNEEVKPVTQNKNGNQKKVGATVQIYVGYTIPIVLRVGQEDVKAEIEQISFKTNEKGYVTVLTPITRTGGAYGIMGHLFVYHIAPDGTEEKVGEISNAHIFPEVNRRVHEVTLIKKISGGKLRVVLKNYDKKNDFTYAEKVFPLN